MSLEVNPGMFLDQAPPRIIGTECEYDVQNRTAGGRRYSKELYISPGAVDAAGLRMVENFLTNGAKLYIDTESTEYAPPEALGPKQAAAADMAGIIAMQRIIEASGVTHQGVYRNAGTYIDKKYSSSPDSFEGEAIETRGYHENYLFPRSISCDWALDGVMPSHLASRLYAMAGTVDDGFIFSQKAQGLGGPVINRGGLSRTRAYHGAKPMFAIPTANEDFDVLGSYDWARLEVRFAEPGFSPTARFLALASTSLVLRLVEHKNIIGEDRLRKLSLNNPLEAALLFSEDLSMKETTETLDGEKLTALDIQEKLSEMEFELSQKVELPEDEVKAITLIRNIVDKMRKSNPKKADYGDLIYVWDAAAKHNYLSRSLSQMAQHKGNPEAVQKNFIWDRILPDGGAIKWWSMFGSEIITKEDIDGLVFNAPKTRASLRANSIEKNPVNIKEVYWSHIIYDDDSNITFTDPYASTE